MKTNIRRLISIICVAVMLVVFAVPVMADVDSLAFDMESLGITAGMDAGVRQSEFVRRDEFAQMVVNMMMQQDVAAALEESKYFTDIADSKYKGAINLLAQLKYISGDGSGVFDASGYITYGAACKILVHALGYDVITEGTDLFNYIMVAGNIGVSDKVDSGVQYLTFRQAMVMVNNALDIGLMVPLYYNANVAPSYVVDVNRTYRSYLNGRTGTGIVKMRGIITADATTYLYGPVKNLKPDQIQINGKVYNFKGTAPKGYVGQEVEFYMTRADYEDGYITSVVPTNKNVICDFTGKNVSKISSDIIEFYANGGTKYKVEYNYATRFIVNNRVVSNYNIVRELDVDENVVIRTIDNNEDEIADVVFIYDYTDCIIESTSSETMTIVFEDGFKYGTTKNIKLDEDKISWEIYDAKGNEISYDSLDAGDVVSIAVSANGQAVRIIKGIDPVVGVISSQDGKYIMINDTEYVMGETMSNKDVAFGVNVTAYPNFMGVLVDYEEEKTENNYAYVYSYNVAKDITGEVKVKLLLPEYISIKKVEGEVDELSGEVSTSNALFVRNKDVVMYTAEAKILYNGVRTKAEKVFAEVLDKPVSYYLNENGKIAKINTLEGADSVEIKASETSHKCVSLNKKKYNGTEQLFGGSKGTPFGIQKDYTLAFCVPVYSEQAKSTVSDDDLKVFVELSNGLEYESNGYEIDDVDSIAEVLVIQRVMNANGSIPVNDTSDIGMVLSVSNVLSEDKSTEHMAIRMITDGKEQRFVIAETRVNQPEINKIEKNDLILYTLDAFDQINSVKVIQKSDEYYESFSGGYLYGEVKNVQHNKISNKRVRRVNIVDLGYTGVNSVETTVELLTRNPVPVFIMEGKNVRVGSLNDIQVGDMTYISIYSLTEVRAIVIKR